MIMSIIDVEENMRDIVTLTFQRDGSSCPDYILAIPAPYGAPFTPGWLEDVTDQWLHTVWHMDCPDEEWTSRDFLKRIEMIKPKELSRNYYFDKYWSGDWESSIDAGCYWLKDGQFILMREC